MSRAAAGLVTFFAELKRRRVVQVAAVYLAAAFVVLQAAEMLLPALLLPEWSFRLLVAVALLAFPLALVLAWAYDITPAGIQRTPPVAAAAVAALPSDSAPVPAPAAREPAPAAPAAADGRSIAVLPFVNMSADAENEYFSDGLTEELLNVLAQVDGLQVAARTSSFHFKGRNVPVDEIGRQLRVAHLLEGSVRKAGNRVRITAQLIRAGTGYHLWSETFDRQLEDIFAVQDEIARAVADALRVRLHDPGAPLPTTGRQTSIEAHEFYLRGRFFFNQGSRASFDKALECYRRSLALDPRYAQAYAGIAEVYGFLADAHLPPREAYPKAIEAAERALELQPDLPDALAMLALGKAIYEWDWDGARAALERAVRLNPNSWLAQVGYFHYWPAMGDLQKTIEAARRSCEIDPLAPVSSELLGWLLTWSGAPDEALKLHRRTQEIAPDFIYHDAFIGEAYAAKGMTDEAVAAFRRGEEIIGHPSTGLGVLFARLGQRAEAEAIARELEVRFEQGGYCVPELLARVHAALGDRDSAFFWLRRGQQARSAAALYLRLIPELEPLRDDPRFTELEQRMNLR